MTAPARVRRLRGRLRRDRSGVSLVEFALGLPVLLGFTLGGLEMVHYVIAVNTSQRLATMMADMISQSGVGDISTTEAQIYDMFQAIDVSAKPLNMRDHGRVIFTVVRGERGEDAVDRNVYADGVFAQQFDGGYVAAVPRLGCHKTQAAPTLNRVLPPNEILVHAQVSYDYQTLLPRSAFSYFNVPTEITRVATFRMRKNQFNITNDNRHPPKSNCSSADGL